MRDMHKGVCLPRFNRPPASPPCAAGSPLSTFPEQEHRNTTRVAVASHTAELRSRLAAIMSRRGGGSSEGAGPAEDDSVSPLRTSAQAAPGHGDNFHGSSSVALAHGAAISMHAEVGDAPFWEERQDVGGVEDSAPREQRSESFVSGTAIEDETARRRRIGMLDDLLGRIDMLEWMVQGEQ